MPREMARWDPFRDVLGLRSDIDRLMGTLAGAAPRSSLPTRWAPSADLIEREDEIVITAELPGVADEDVEITIDEGVLRISGARDLTEEVDDERFHRIERSYGSFERQVRRECEPTPISSPGLSSTTSVTPRHQVGQAR